MCSGDSGDAPGRYAGRGAGGAARAALRLVAGVGAAAVVLLSAAYPFTGFVTRRVEGFLDDDRERVVNAFRAEGFVPADDDGEGMTFRAASPLRRLWLHFDDEVRVAQFGQWIELSGQRRTVARVAPRLEGYIAAHARTKE